MSGFINDQSFRSKERGSFGRWGNIAQCGCGSIAIYNADLLLGRDPDYDEILAMFRRPSMTFMLGRWGSNPLALRRYYKKCGCRVKVYRDMAAVPRDARAYIAYYSYKDKRGWNAHLAALSCDPVTGVVTAYNDDDAGRLLQYTSFADMRIKNKALRMYVMTIDI